jgi:superfamily II DNA or RNA helicase
MVQVDVVIASNQTLGRDEASSTARLARYKGWPGIVIVDEAHHMKVPSTYDTILKSLGVGGRPMHTKKQEGQVRACYE